MQNVWTRIETWLSEHAPHALAELCDPAEAADLDWAEKAIGATLPASVRESYLIHDGADGVAFLGYWDFLSLGEMVATWKRIKEAYDAGYFAAPGEPLEGTGVAHGPVRPQGWNPKWIPFAERDEVFVCLDLDPDQEGVVGQLLLWDPSSPERELVAESFEGWWQTFADELESGERALDADGALVVVEHESDDAPEESLAEESVAAESVADDSETSKDDAETSLLAESPIEEPVVAETAPEGIEPADAAEPKAECELAVDALSS
ncbi:MAG TPA: SMI1/KNR4 family protein [Pirellulales bacterium]